MLHKCFKKIRIKSTYNSKIDKLFQKRNSLRRLKDIDDEKKSELERVEAELSDNMAEDMFKIVKDEVDKVNCEEGGFHSGHLWRLKNKLKPKYNNYPTAMIDKEGKLVTTQNGLKTLAMEHYQKVLEDRPIVEGLI